MGTGPHLPAPPDFIGSTFLKHLLYASVPDPRRLQRPVDAEEFEAITAPVWIQLDRLRPHLWRGGAAYPAPPPSPPGSLRRRSEAERPCRRPLALAYTWEL